MKHAILGAGGVGGLVGTVLAAVGEDVLAIVRPERLKDCPDTFSVERPSGPVNARVRCVSSLTETVDVLWIATKTFQMNDALRSVSTPPKQIVPLLNGADHVDVLRARFGHDCVIPATIAVEAEKLAPGRFVQRSPFVRLNLAGSGEKLLAGVVARLTERGFTCQFIANEQTLLWSKLCFLGPFAMVTSASGMNNGEVAANPEWKSKLAQAIDEACAVANAKGADLDPAKIHAFVASASPGMRSSMQKDVAAGRPLELDDISRPILRGGKQHGIPVPATESLVAAIRAKAGARIA
jgi:2-dehydropantoate 2-reductase